MDIEPYNALLRDCFSNPHHAGEIGGGARAYLDERGLRIRLSARVSNGLITKLRFLAWACPHVIASAELFCRNFEGGSVADIDQFRTEQIMQNLAVPVEKTGRILALEDTIRSLRAAIEDQRLTVQE